MKKIIVYILVISFIACQNEQHKTSDVSKKNDSLESAIKLRNELLKKIKDDSIAYANSPQRLDDIKRRDILIKDFEYKYDEFKKIGWYTQKKHTVEKMLTKICLYAHINNSGIIYLEDQYYAKDWIFHTNIQVKIGDKILQSEIIPTSQRENTHENYDGYIWENIHYTDGRDNGILQAIAENSNTEIKIRFVGEQYHYDFILPKIDKEAIKETYELYQLFKKVGIN